jgi:tape measure domain-containing protein
VAEQLGEAVLRLSVDDQALNAGLQRARTQAGQTGQQMERAFGGVSNVLSSIAGLAGVVGIGALTQQIISTGQASERSKIQLQALAGAYGEAGQAAQSVQRIQKVLGISALDARQSFAQLYAALRGTGIGLEQLEVLFVGVSNAARLSGASTAEAQGALLQLKQGLAAGVLQGDELRSVLEGLPALSQAIAKKLGVSVGQVKQLGSEGKITSKIVFDAAKSLADATVPGRSQVEQLGIAYTNLRETAAEAFGPALVSSIQTVSAGIQAFAGFLKANREGLGQFAQSVLGIARTLAPLAIGILAVQAAFKAWAIAVNAVRLAQAGLLALSGPKGWTVLLGAVLATAVAAKVLEKGFEGSKKGIEEARKAAEKALKDFQALSASTTLEPPTPTNADSKVQEAQRQASAQQALNVITAQGLQQELAYKRQLLALELQSLRTGEGISATTRTQKENQQAILAARRQVAQAQAAVDAELAKPADKRSSAEVDNLLFKVDEANAGVRKAYLDAGLSLVQNARTAADALKSAQANLQGILRGGFEFLTPQLQQEQLARARAAIQPQVDAGIIRSGIDISTPDKLFRVAAFAEQLAPAQKQLEDAVRENAAATSALSRKDWNVYVSVPGQATPVPLPRV